MDNTWAVITITNTFFRTSRAEISPAIRQQANAPTVTASKESALTSDGNFIAREKQNKTTYAQTDASTNLCKYLIIDAPPNLSIRSAESRTPTTFDDTMASP